jgi:hypothetical protein
MAKKNKSKDKKAKKSKGAGKALKGEKKGDKKEKKGKKAKKSLAPRAISTGKGAAPAEIGADLVARFNRGEFQEIEETWWSPKVTSVEGVGVAMAWEGRKAVQAKNKGWTEANAIRSARAEGPFVGATGFAVKFFMDVEEKATGKRTAMEEVGVYEVKNGKIVREEFMYGSMKSAGAADLAPVGG